MRDLATEETLARMFAARALPFHAEVHDTLPSTNTALRDLAIGGAPHGTVLWAKAQSAGKGSRGRTFCSPAGGLYASVLLREYRDPMGITCAAAVATHEAVHTVLGISTDIKWVNDLYLSGRKVCGILCEGVTVGSTLVGAVLGIGINLAPPAGGYPPEIQGIAGALCTAMPSNETCAKLLAELLARLHAHLADSTAAYMETYRTRNLVRGRKVLYRVGGAETVARVQDITVRGSLLLATESGEVREAFSGEVALLPQNA